MREAACVAQRLCELSADALAAELLACGAVSEGELLTRVLLPAAKALAKAADTLDARASALAAPLPTCARPRCALS